VYLCDQRQERQESYTVGASYLSLTDVGKASTSGGGKGTGKKQKGAAGKSEMLASSGTNLGSTTLLRRPSHIDLSNCFSKSSYFSDINPRSMKRLMNILAVTGGILYFLYSLPSFVIGHFYQIIIQMFLTIPTGFTFWPIQICCSCWNLKKFRQRMHVT